MRRDTKVAAVLALAIGVVGSVPAATSGPVPARLVGTWGATLPNYPAVGLYKGRYKLKIGPGSIMHYIVPGEGAIVQGISVSSTRITFRASGVCLTQGTYTWTVNSNTLTFEKVRDTCRKRVVQLVRRWTRLSS
jgi:hypothetical protein